MSWKHIPLSEVADFSNGINFDKSAYSSGVKLIGVSNFGNRFSPDYDELQEVNSQVVRQNDYLKNGDIVFVRSNGNKELVGRCMLIKDPPYSITYSGFCIRARLKDTNEYDPVFFTYYFKSNAFRKALAGNAIGANIQNLSQGRLANHIANIPCIDTQRKIACVLSAYDDLIENNQNQIKLLEEAAQRLYKEWFVDLRFPGHENTPIVEGVPEGWHVSVIGNICDAVGGGTPSTKIDEYYRDGKIKWVTPTDITRNSSLILLDTEKHITDEGLHNSSAKMLPPYTILMTSRASVGYFGLCEHPVCTNQGFISCIPHDEKIRFYLLYNLMYRVEEIRGKATGSTFLEITKKNFRELPILIPDTSILRQFNEVLTPIIKQMEVLTKAIKMLQEARDRLLPKLMNGEIEV